MSNEAEQRAEDAGRMVVRSFGVRVRAVREEAREIDFVASTDAVDSYGEVVDQGSWRLERYRSNPIVLFAHRSRELPIGKSVRTEVVNGKLECTIRFASEKANPMAEQVWQLCREDVLRSVSVGFIPNDGRYEMRDGDEVFVLSNCELYEISVTPVPANAEALAKMKAKARDAANQERAVARHEETTIMNEKELQARVSQLETEKKAAEDRAAVAEKSLAEATEKAVVLEKDLAEATQKHAAAEDRAKSAEDKLVENEVAALVGVKIVPAEKDAVLELAKSNHDLFLRQMAARPELKLLSPVVAAEKQATSTATIDANGEDLAAIAAKDAESVVFD